MSQKAYCNTINSSSVGLFAHIYEQSLCLHQTKIDKTTTESIKYNPNYKILSQELESNCNIMIPFRNEAPEFPSNVNRKSGFDLNINRNCTSNAFVAIAPYHEIKSRLWNFLEHYGQIMRREGRLNLLISTLFMDKEDVQKAAERKLSQSVLERFHLVSNLVFLAVFQNFPVHCKHRLSGSIPGGCLFFSFLQMLVVWFIVFLKKEIYIKHI